MTADAANIIIIPFDEDTPGVQEGSFCRQIIEQKNLQGRLPVCHDSPAAVPGRDDRLRLLRSHKRHKTGRFLSV
ncbi:MAG: hypothetical protein PHT73_06900 [bacterium]|nr:hypothetical protein [bacterium]